MGNAWREQHASFQELKQKLEDFNARDDLDRDERFEHAEPLRLFEHDDEAEALFRALLGEKDDAKARYRLADYLLEKDREEGVAHGEAATAHEPRLEMTVRELFYGYYARQGDVEAAKVQQHALEDADALHRQTDAERANFDPAADTALAPDFDADTLQDMMELVNLDPRIIDAYLFKKELEVMHDRRHVWVT